jgi:hypothetical protein
MPHNTIMNAAFVTVRFQRKPTVGALLLLLLLLLQTLSLDLQSADAPSLGSTLGWLCAAVKEGVAAAQKFPGAASRLTACLLHIPRADVQQLKVNCMRDLPI